MKTKATLLALALAAVRLGADTLATDTAVFIQTDPQAPVIARLKAGSTVVYTGEAPAGWRRIELSGPFEAYVQNRDVTKGLEIREGASIYSAPRKDAPVMTVAARGDKSEITGLHGDWCQISLEKKIQGFIAVGDEVNKPGLAAAPLPSAPAEAAPMPAAPTGNLGHPVPITGNSADMPRLFSGRLVEARRAILNPNPLYEYQLVDSSGRRFAYVDTKSLLLTGNIENMVGLVVSITGTVRNTVDGKDLVIAAESMQVK